MIKKLIKKLFVVNVWACAYRVLDNQELGQLPERNKGYKYKLLKMNHGYWAADPFIVKKNHDVHVFFEYNNMNKAKAVIAEKLIEPDIDNGETIIYEFPYHTSYPCLFTVNGDYYMVPETSQAGTVELLKCVSWPDKWKRETILSEGKRFVDSTFFDFAGVKGLFLYETETESSPNRKLYFAEFDDNIRRIGELNLLREFADFGGRPGGNILFVNDSYIRVVQPKTHYYGEKIEFYKFDPKKLNDQYHEDKILEFCPEQVLVDLKHGKVVGVHTFNRFDEYEVVDLLIEQFDMFRLLKGLLRRLNIFGYGLYETNGKMLSGDEWR